jgi:uncharacterized RDD family membrane protein YckC
MTSSDGLIEPPRIGMWWRMRAGFWRRVLALLVDAALVLIPLQVVVAILFTITNGAIQGNFGFTITTCSPVGDLPEGVQPPPPEGFNQIADCRISLIGFDTARSLTVTKVTQDGNTTRTVFQSYVLGADGKPREDFFDTTWLAILALFAYLVLLEFRSGKTVGKHIAGIRTIDTALPDRIGIPLGKAALRQLAMWVGFAPALAAQFLLLGSVATTSDLEAVMNGSYYVPLSILGAILALAWIVWIIVSLARKRDPVYDRLVGTAVVCT